MEFMSGRRIRSIGAVHLAGDVFSLAVAYVLTLHLRFCSEWGQTFFDLLYQWLGVRGTGELDASFVVFYLESSPRILLLIGVTLVVLYALLDLYSGRRFLRRRPELWHILLANAIALLIFYAYFYLDRNTFHPRSFVATLMALNVVITAVTRRAIFTRMRMLRRLRHFDVWPTLVVGHGQHADNLVRVLESTKPRGFAVAERLRWRPSEPLQALFTEMDRATQRHGAAALLVAEPGLDVKALMAIIEKAGGLGLVTKVLSDHFGVLVTHARLPVEMADGLPLVHFESNTSGRWAEILRLRFSQAAAVVVLLLLLPLFGLIALVIKLSSPGPVLFVQERMGVDRRPFRMIKFRTMRNRAEQDQAELEEFNESGSGLFKIRRDPRITPVGRVLRRFSLDELPQFWNVLRGEMVLVGPRPLPRRDFEHYYEDWHYGRHSGMPGLTCLWQVSGRSELDFHNMCILDVYYLKNRSLVLDMQIIVRTLQAVVLGRGAY
jgi:exopolysaccharide biosynthesis polyprenyl glycosylphosphotransferase